MAEKIEMHREYLKKVNELLNGDVFGELLKGLADLDSSVKKSKVSLEEKIKAFAQKRKEEEIKAQEVEKVEVETEPAVVEQPVVETEVAPVVEKVVETKEVETAPVVEVKEEVKEVPKPRPTFIVRHESVEKPAPKKAQNVYKPNDEKKSGFNKEKTFKPSNDKPEFKKPKETYVAPAVVPTSNDKRSFGNKKKGGNDKQYEDKHVINKRALIKNQVDVDDFDENKTGYRKFRPVKKAKEQK